MEVKNRKERRGMIYELQALHLHIKRESVIGCTRESNTMVVLRKV
jgi:hypothetical protein